MNRIKYGLFFVALHIDSVVLKLTAWALYHAKEWFSWSQRGVARVVLSAWPACIWLMPFYYMARTMTWPGGKVFTFAMEGVFLILAAATTFSAWMTWKVDSRRSNDRKMFLLFYPPAIVTRVAGLVFPVAIACFLIALPPHNWSSNLPAMTPCLGSFFLGVYNYVDIVPGSGQKGRKRKEALDKIKGLFWIPVPSES